METLKSLKGQNALFRLDAFATFLMFLMFQKVTSEYLFYQVNFLEHDFMKKVANPSSLNRAFLAL